MSNAFNILTVRDETQLETEQIGSKPKFWFANPEDSNHDWLFKYARQGTGEHWAEKVVAEIARHLNIPHAQVELAVCRELKGSASKSFIPRHINAELIHGNEILSGRVLGYDRDKRYSQNEHTFDNIVKAVRATGTKKEADTALHVMAGYLILDALVGNTDRHHENWAFIRYTKSQAIRYEAAPTFDHASSLGRELQDIRRLKYLRENNVETYALRGRGAIYITGEEGKGVNPTDLVIFANDRYPIYFRGWLTELKNFDLSTIKHILQSIPDEWISDHAREFAYRLTAFNYKRLLEGCI